MSRWLLRRDNPVPASAKTSDPRAWGLVVVAVLLAWLTAAPALGEPVEVDPPVKISVAPENAERLRGWLTRYDETGFTIKTTDEKNERVEWSQLPPDRVMWVQEKLLDRDDARGWFVLAAMLYPREDGQREAELALRRAVNANPGLAAKAERLRAGEAVDIDAPEPTSSTGGGPDIDDDQRGGASNGGRGGPVTVGRLESKYWGNLSDELMQSSTAELKAQVRGQQEKLGQRLTLHDDSDFFLFYTDIPNAEARRWVGLLDSMYDRLCDIFDLDRGTNIFRGRCVIIVFADPADYHRFHSVNYGFDSRGSAGLCRSFNNGFVEVTFPKDRKELNFARVLVHEAVHAFVHRYRSHPRVVSWINEGLAEYVSTALVEDRGFGESDYARRLDQGKRHLRERRTLGGDSFFKASHIDGWQYPIAQMLTEFMIRQSGSRYRAFITGIKDGKSWQQALEEDYGLTVEQLVTAFGRAQGIRDLRP